MAFESAKLGVDWPSAALANDGKAQEFELIAQEQEFFIIWVNILGIVVVLNHDDWRQQALRRICEVELAATKLR